MKKEAPYTPGIRGVFKMAKEEAGRLGHDHIAPEHYLLGIIRKGAGMAIQILLNLGVTGAILNDLRVNLEERLKPGKKPAPTDHSSSTPEAMKILDSAREISRGLKHDWVGSEHLLLALIRAEETVAGQCIRQLGIQFHQARQEALNVIEGPGGTDKTFLKMTGAGNDFVVMDNRGLRIPEDGRAGWVASLCRRAVSVGADGVLLVEPPRDGGDFRMRYYNADGGEAETCGNGARCIARFAHTIGAAPARMTFETVAGKYGAEVLPDGEVEIGMTDPFDLRLALKLDLPGMPPVEADCLNTGVPHAVVWTEDLENADVVGVGRAIRRHPVFAPAGTNANFVRARPGGGLDIRTYERGVEAETLACGTGCVAAAALAALAGRAEPPVRLHTRGGAILAISFDHDGESFRHVRLRGEARFVYSGALIEPFPKSAA